MYISQARRPDARDDRCQSLVTCFAFAMTVARKAAPPFPALLRLSAPLGLPSFTPRAFTDASATFVDCEIASGFACATCAMMPTVRSFASGMSTATKVTPLSRRATRKAALRLGWSSSIITRVAQVPWHDAAPSPVRANLRLLGHLLWTDRDGRHQTGDQAEILVNRHGIDLGCRNVDQSDRLRNKFVIQCWLTCYQIGSLLCHSQTPDRNGQCFFVPFA